MKLPPLSHLLLPLALASAALVSACQGCRPGATLPAEGPAPKNETPTVRLYFLSSVAGALEPCGCSKNQLGGVDHLGSFLRTHEAEAPHSLLAAAGPLFFLDPTPRGEQATQDRWKAEALASALGKLHFAAWAPGANDWAGGGANLAQLREKSGGALLAANLEGDTAGAAPTALRESGGVKVGFVGLSQPVKAGLAPAGVIVKPAAAQLAAAITQLKGQGAQVLVGLFAMPRGEALRLAEGAPELQVVAVGKPFDQGEANDKPAPPSMLGQTLVVETANHLQTAAIVDLHVRGNSYTFQDAAGISRASDREGLDKRITELEGRIRKWEQDATIKADDLAQRRAELARLRGELQQLEQPRPPAAGSFFRYTMLEIKTELGRDDGIYLSMLDFYRKVNEYNKTTFADRKAPPPGPDGNRYVGIEVCGSCHAEAKKVWENTPHAGAYKTLVTQHKEYNLDCVSCHVTGYERPGGSTVTDNALLQAVQCENCHGPGEKHRQNPRDKTLLIGKPAPASCVGACHHPPHVDGFDPVAQMHRILGPGHGNPDEWPPKKPR
jgi:hypothetical protein